MSRDLLYRAADRVESASDAVTDPETGDRLVRLADRLRSEADREATPALGTLDRIHSKLGVVEGGIDDATATAALDDAREDIVAFLGTLDDRGMQQH